MPEVVVDTSPLQYLFQLSLLDLLPAFYGEVVVPEGVLREIATGRAIGVSLPDVKTLPWLQVRRVSSPGLLPLVAGLGIGEREVLALAIELKDPLVILDDSLARRFARSLDIALTGTLGLLLKAKQVGRIDRVGPLLDQLEDLQFRLDRRTRAGVLELAGE